MVRTNDNTCPNAASHTDAPRGYLAWHDWAEKMMKTHTQTICQGCGRYAIWVPKEMTAVSKKRTIR